MQEKKQMRQSKNKTRLETDYEEKDILRRKTERVRREKK